MAQLMSIKCDECGAIKGDQNHWYHAIAGPRGWFAIAPFGNAADIVSSKNAAHLDLCGDACAIQAFAKALGKA